MYNVSFLHAGKFVSQYSKKRSDPDFVLGFQNCDVSCKFIAPDFVSKQ